MHQGSSCVRTCSPRGGGIPHAAFWAAAGPATWACRGQITSGIGDQWSLICRGDPGAPDEQRKGCTAAAPRPPLICNPPQKKNAPSTIPPPVTSPAHCRAHHRSPPAPPHSTNTRPATHTPLARQSPTARPTMPCRCLPQKHRESPRNASNPFAVDVNLFTSGVQQYAHPRHGACQRHAIIYTASESLLPLQRTCMTPMPVVTGKPTHRRMHRVRGTVIPADLPVQEGAR